MKRNWNVTIVVPGRENNDGTTTPSLYFTGKRIDGTNGTRKLVDMVEVPAPALVNHKTGKVTR